MKRYLRILWWVVRASPWQWYQRWKWRHRWSTPEGVEQLIDCLEMLCGSLERENEGIELQRRLQEPGVPYEEVRKRLGLDLPSSNWVPIKIFGDNPEIR